MWFWKENSETTDFRYERKYIQYDDDTSVMQVQFCKKLPSFHVSSFVFIK